MKAIHNPFATRFRFQALSKTKVIQNNESNSQPSLWTTRAAHRCRRPKLFKIMKAIHNLGRRICVIRLLSKTKVIQNNESNSQLGLRKNIYLRSCRRPKLFKIMKAIHNVATSSFNSLNVVEDQSYSKYSQCDIAFQRKTQPRFGIKLHLTKPLKAVLLPYFIYFLLHFIFFQPQVIFFCKFFLSY